MSMTISGIGSNAAAPSVKEPPQIRQADVEPPAPVRAPVTDEYIPEEKQEPSGRYWLGKDENGRFKVYFDDPERTDDKPSPAKEDKAERCTANTDQVDREIKRLKQRKETLEQQISSQPDEARRSELERMLAQVERELAQKDNDTYRRQHTVFS